MDDSSKRWGIALAVFVAVYWFFFRKSSTP